MEEQTTVGLRIKKLREQLELKQADFAQQLSEDPKKISRIEKEVQFPDSNFLIQLGDRLDVSLDWILRGVGKMFLSDSDSSSANFFPSEVNSGDFAFVPVYDVNASAGHGAFNDFGSEQAIQHMAFLNSWIHGNLSSSAERMVVIRAVETACCRPSVMAIRCCWMSALISQETVFIVSNSTKLFLPNVCSGNQDTVIN